MRATHARFLPEELTHKEQNAVLALQDLSRRWPKSLWVFVGDGSFHVMRCGLDGERVVTGDGGVDSTFVVATIPIPADGGGW